MTAITIIAIIYSILQFQSGDKFYGYLMMFIVACWILIGIRLYKEERDKDEGWK